MSMRIRMKKTYRIKTNNQEQLQRKQNESDATSKWIEFQKTRPRRRIQDKDVPVIDWISAQLSSRPFLGASMKDRSAIEWKSLRKDSTFISWFFSHFLKAVTKWHFLWIHSAGAGTRCMSLLFTPPSLSSSYLLVTQFSFLYPAYLLPSLHSLYF